MICMSCTCTVRACTRTLAQPHISALSSSCRCFQVTSSQSLSLSRALTPTRLHSCHVCILDPSREYIICYTITDNFAKRLRRSRQDENTLWILSLASISHRFFKCSFARFSYRSENCTKEVLLALGNLDLPISSLLQYTPIRILEL